MTPSISSKDRETLDAARRIKAKRRKQFLASKPPRVEKQGQEPRQTDKAHLQRIRQLPCLATLILEGREVYGVDAAHVRHNYPERGWGGNPGLGRKPHDWRTLPLKREHHARQHSMNEAQFWRELNVYPPMVCQALRDAPDLGAMFNVIWAAAVIARLDEGEPLQRSELSKTDAETSSDNR